MKVLPSMQLRVALALLSASGLALAHESAGPLWPSNLVTMHAYQPDFPVGSPYRAALDVVRNRFFYEQPSAFYFEIAHDAPSVGFGNGENEIWFTDAPGTGPAYASRWVSGSDPFVIVESDVLIDTAHPFTTSNAKTDSVGYGGGAWAFEPLMIHQFGHVAGMSHEADEYNVMGSEWNHVSCNGNFIRSYIGEDAADGLVSLYGPIGAGTIEDVGVSLFKYAGAAGALSAHEPCEIYDQAGTPLTSDGSLTGQPVWNVTSGQSLQVEFTYENNGLSSQGSNLGFYLSDNNYISSGDQFLASHTIIQFRNDVVTRSYAVTLPDDLPVGATYYLGVRIDDTGLLAEAAEDNNAAYHVINVSCGREPNVATYSVEPNADSFSATEFRLGEDFQLTVDLSTTGHLAALPFAFDSVTSFALGGGQVVLCWDGNGSGEMFGLSPMLGPIAQFEGSVPDLPSLCGFFLSAQAIHFGGVVPYALSNAQDITVGY